MYPISTSSPLLQIKSVKLRTAYKFGVLGAASEYM